MAFDLDAARASRREQAKASFQFETGGETYDFPSSKDWPVDAVDRIAEGRVVEGMRLILGDKVWKKIGPTLTLGDVETLVQAVSEYEGFDTAGNSSAPSSPATKGKRRR